MNRREMFDEVRLAALAKRFREHSGVTRSQAARDLGVAHSSIFHAEESPEKSLVRLRIRMIERYSSFKIAGPKYWLEER